MSQQNVTGVSTLQRACDACKDRKIRCDKLAPCSNCKSSEKICRVSVATERNPRSRVTKTREYERKIDLISERLSRIEACLERTPTSFSPSRSGDINKTTQIPIEAPLERPSSPTCVPSGLVEVSTDQATPIDTFDATVNSHSVLAAKVLNEAIGDIPANERHPALFGAWEKLKEMLREMNENSEPVDFDITLCRKADEQVASPSLLEIRNVIGRSCDSVLFTFFPVFSTQLLMQKCEELFRKPKDYGPIRQVLVFGALFELCSEYRGDDKDSAVAGRYAALATSFLRKLQAAMARLPMIIDPSTEAVTALLIAVLATVELGKPYLALSLISSAAFMVTSLGYNRLSSMLSDDDQQREQKVFLFWTVYMLDVSFSVRLSRLPVIRDHEITVPMISDSGAPAGILSYSIALGRIQCEAVEALYSPSSLGKGLEERVRCTAKLTKRLEDMWCARSQSSLEHGLNGHKASHFFLFRRSEAIAHYSTLALVQYAARPAWNGDSPALDAARQALRLSADMVITATDLPEGTRLAHCHWTLLHAPLTPLTVTFCNVVADPTNADPDLCLLQDFVKALRALRHLSEGAAKLHSLCDIFQKIAFLYVQAKGQQTSIADHETHSTIAFTRPAMQATTRDIDACLSTIGLAPFAGSNYARTSAEYNSSEMTYLNDWFHGNNSLMEFFQLDGSYMDWSNADPMSNQ